MNSARDYNRELGHAATRKYAYGFDFEVPPAISNTACLMALGGLAAMLAAAIATVIWGANRGLGEADEGVYLLSARYPEDFLQNVSAVYDYTGACSGSRATTSLRFGSKASPFYCYLALFSG